MSKWVYQFDEVAKAEKYAGSWEDVRALLGGKGAQGHGKSALCRVIRGTKKDD